MHGTHAPESVQQYGDESGRPQAGHRTGKAAPGTVPGVCAASWRELDDVLEVSTAYSNLRELVRMAVIGGADPAWLDDVTLELTELLLSIDPRKLHTEELRKL
jgi:hypothetical protein